VNWLTPGGAATAALVGAAVTVGMGWAGLVLLFAFFVPASLVTGPGGRDAREAQGRTARQVVANGGVAALAALLGWGTAAAGAIAAAAADTWATEIGRRSARPPRLITTGRPVAAGTSGGVTPFGTLAGAGAAIALATLHTVLPGGWAASGIAVAVAGVAGMMGDSLLGATWQARFRCPGCGAVHERREAACHAPLNPARGLAWLDNDAVNLAATLVGAGGAGVLERWLT
jgi:uncharacterized protein (TIGR00297 family)